MKTEANNTLTYSSYLKVSELISLQRPLSDPPAHDEMLFIVIHQAYELWFKQILFELPALIRHLEINDFLMSFRILDRVCEIFRVLIQQVDILETMTPVEFNRFRSNLNPASGFQSFQFREFELLAGADPEEYQKFFDLEPEWKNKLTARANKTNLRDAFFGVLERRGLLQSRKAEAVVSTVLNIYIDHTSEPELQRLCEHFIQFDEQVSLWRFRHVQMVERMIGMKSGTGGSLGVAYLKTTLRKRFFPELWDARTGMNGGKRY